MWIILVIVLTFALCYAVDKGYTKLFRSRKQHRSGLSLRQNKRYGSMGLVLLALGIAAMITSAGNVALLVGGIILLVLGIGLAVFYLSFGIYYDEDGFLLESFGKKPLEYRYDNILHQQLYVVQGGSRIIELHMTDGSAVQIVTTMPEYEKFLSYAFKQWCNQKGISVETCKFYDPTNHSWFPAKEEIECTSQV